MQRESYEFVGDKDEAVGKLLAGLPHVEAPSDFEMRVRARIASGRKAGTSWLTPLVRVAVPAAFLLAIGGYFGFYALYSDSEPISITETYSADRASTTTPHNQEIVKPTDEPMPEAIAAESDKTSVPAVPNSSDPSVAPRSTQRRGANDSDIDTAESALTQAKVITQPGRANQSLQNLNPADGGPGISLKAVFETFGMNAGFTSGAWRVASIVPNSVADRSGVKAGDIVEALNDQPLAEKTVLGRTFAGKSVQVRRDGRTIKLDLRP